MEPFIPATSIEEVLSRLDIIIEEARIRNSRTGYFAVLYRDVTSRVKDGIATGRFEDGPRMERLDVIFANRYLEAFRQYDGGQPCSRCWKLGLDATRDDRLLILQHLLLGMNAHINLDLGIAAAECAPGSELTELESDFREINQLLIEMLEDVQSRLATVSPWFGLLDRIGGHFDEMIARFGLRGFRDGAWISARVLAPLSPEMRVGPIEEIDRATTHIGHAIQNPPGSFFRIVRWIVRRRESRSAAEVIDALRIDTS